MPTRLQIARKDIVQVFDDHPSKILMTREIGSIVAAHRGNWRLAQNTRVQDVIEYLSKNVGKLRRLEFSFPGRSEIRYTWGDVPLHAVLMTLKKDCHFSHYTAMQMHDLTEQDPKAVYLNFEQPPKPRSAAGLQQDRIDAAFARGPRLTNNIATLGGTRIVLLNGMHTRYLGIETRSITTGDADATLRLTDLERTLVDIAVRPFYSGGVGEVLKAFERAAPRASTNRVAALLADLDYVYPYHQAIGYYLETCGRYSKSAVELFRQKFELKFDFYLTYSMKNPRYVERWRLYVPEGL